MNNESISPPVIVFMNAPMLRQPVLLKEEGVGVGRRSDDGVELFGRRIKSTQIILLTAFHFNDFY